MNPGYRRHKFISAIIKPFVTLFLKLRFGFRRGKMRKEKGPFIVVCNHVTNFDMMFIACTFKEYIYFVASEHTFRAGFASKLLRWVFDPIGRTKASVAGSTVMEMKKRLKAGHNICIFAEGLRTASGLTQPVMPATARVLQMFGAPIITYKLHGGYFAHPRWGYTIRRGYMDGELVQTYTPEMLKSMSTNELNDAINRDLYEDAYEWNKEHHIAYKGKRLAEGIEFELVACPKCKKLNSIKSKKDRFWCDCGLNGRYDLYGGIEGEGFDFTTVRDWDEWERGFIAELPDYDGDFVLASDPDQTLCEVGTDHTTVPVANGALSITPKELRIGEFTVALEDISLYDIILQGYLLFSTKDGRHFEIHDSRHKFAGFLYQLLIKRYKPTEEKVNVKRQQLQ